MHPRSNPAGVHPTSPWAPAKHSPAWFQRPCCGCVFNKTKEKRALFHQLKKNHTKKLNKCYLNPMSSLHKFNTEHRSILKPQDTTKGLLDHLCGRLASDVALPKNPSEAVHAKAKSDWQLHPSRKQLGLLLSSTTSITTTPSLGQVCKLPGPNLALHSPECYEIY